jgi:hypothetical protein
LSWASKTARDRHGGADLALHLPCGLPVVAADLGAGLGDHLLDENAVGVDEVHLVIAAVPHSGRAGAGMAVVTHEVVEGGAAHIADQVAAFPHDVVHDLSGDGAMEGQEGVKGGQAIAKGGEKRLLLVAAAVEEEQGIAVGGVDDGAGAPGLAQGGVEPDVAEAGLCEGARGLPVEADQAGGGKDAAVAVDGEAIPASV